jgi:hypothetical protein
VEEENLVYLHTVPVSCLVFFSSGFFIIKKKKKKSVAPLLWSLIQCVSINCSKWTNTVWPLYGPDCACCFSSGIKGYKSYCAAWKPDGVILIRLMWALNQEKCTN